MKELLKRVLVAVVGIPLAVFTIFQGGLIFLGLILLISNLALIEFYNLFEKKEIFPHKWTGLIFNNLIITTFYYEKILSMNSNLISLEIGFLGVLIVGKELWSKKHKPLMNTASTMLGIVYLTLSFSMLVGLRNIFFMNYDSLTSHMAEKMFLNDLGISMSNTDLSSAWIVMLTLISIWVCDSAAYFVGRKIGKHKLYPKISPNKSWEGTIAGFLGAILSFVLIAKFVLPDFPIIHSIIIGAISGSIGQLGDLAESQFKRDAGVKDSSNILPGHGGIYDRFDSIIFVAPIIYIYFSIIKMLY